MFQTSSSRRDLLKRAAGLAGLSGLALLGTPAADEECTIVAAPGLTEGPYFVDEILNRVDIRLDPTDGSVQAGTQFDLTINFSRVDSCASTPLVGACVDIWHCNAAGVYSDVGTAAGKKFLRGYQMTDRQGQVKFTTIFPGWYQGRAVHIHFKVRTFLKNEETYEFTSQFFFEDDLINTVYSQGEYASKGLPDTRNASDGIYNGGASLGPITSAAGSYLVVKSDTVNDLNLLTATANVILDVSAGSTPDQSGGGGGRPPGGGPGGPGGD
jgi:protocatechuate 3,4-dioxygenase beta subunit